MCEAFHENIVVEYKIHIYVTAENRKRHMTCELEESQDCP